MTTSTDVQVPPADRDLLTFAVEMMLRAGDLSRRAFFGQTTRGTKADGTEVTETDLAVEQQIRRELAERVPRDSILGEELAESTGSSGRRWIIDPISGTAYFTRRMPLFAILLAFEDEHGPAIGIINLPMQQELIYAGRSLGCWQLTGNAGDLGKAERVRMGDRVTLDGALLLAANQHTWTDELLLALHRRVMVAGAIHHAAVHVVTGRADIAVLTQQGYDDLAPLPVIVGEAGGRVTDLRGGSVLSGDGSALITNGRMHGELLELIAGLPVTRRGKAI